MGLPLGRIDPGPSSLRDSASKSPSPCYCPFEGRKRRVMLQVIFINSRKEKVPAAQLEEWTSLCQEPCYTEYPAKLLLLQSCCCCYKIVVAVTKLLLLLQNYNIQRNCQFGLLGPPSCQLHHHHLFMIIITRQHDVQVYESSSAFDSHSST